MFEEFVVHRQVVDLHEPTADGQSHGNSEQKLDRVENTETSI